MNQVVAIALLALRQTLRSRVVLALLALLLAAAFLLPLAIRHDGTPEGLIRLHLTYSLGIAGFLLSLVTLWSGCAAISKEADDKTLQLVLVKPVPRLRIWLGKWLALLGLNAVLLALAGGAVAVGLHAQLRRGGFDPAAMERARLTSLTALDTILAPLPDIEADVRADLESWRARNGLPPGVREDVLLDSLRRARLARLYSIPPGESNTWTLPPPESAPAYWLVQFRCDASVPGAARMDAT
ncbi:MAG TPA: ABC transporter permease, partial [Kiritimatiellia bacterium]|nr:ABC transporter permease [Kiritimatiellia bacterium]